MSLSIRAAALLIPLLAGFVAVQVATRLIPRPDGWLLFWGWMVVLVVVSSAAAVATQRLTRRLAPLGALFKLSLVFPDEAPSRFRAAMRSGTTRSLDRLVDGPDGSSSPEQAAAEELLVLMARLNRHDRLTRGHSERVRAYSVMLGEEIGLTSSDLDKLNWAALIHDIGKLEVPESVLNKAGRPTDDEWAVLRRHPAAAAGYVEALRPWLGDWIDAATQHHERYDGQGYPDGLAETNISLAGRIVSIGDAFDVMTAARSYKKPLPAAQARAELSRNAGTQFDPRLVRSFLQISLGRMRWIIGPLGWLSHLPDIIRTPLTVATTGTGFVAAGAVTLAAATGAATSATPSPDDVTEVAVERSITDAPDDPTLEPTAWTDDSPPATTTPSRPDSGDGSGPPNDVTATEAPNDPTTTVPGSSTTIPVTRPATTVPGSSSTIPVTPSATTVPGSPTSTPVTRPATTVPVTRPATTGPGSPTTTPTTSPSSTTPTTSPSSTTTTTTTSPPSTTTATTTTTTTTTTIAATDPQWMIGAGGHATSQPYVPLDGTPAGGALPNYDTDRDSDPGLLIKKGAGLSETDGTKMQRWWDQLGGATHLQGTPILELWVATKDFDTSKSGQVVAGIYDCDASKSDCNLLASGAASLDQADFGSDFGDVAVVMPAIDVHLAANRGLMLKVAVLDTSDDDLWIAYGTTSYPTQLTIAT